MTVQANTVPTESIAERFVREATVASPAAMKLASSGDTWCGVQELETIIKVDPEFSLRVLSLANSAFYSQRHEITSLRQALVVVGDKMVQRLAAGALAHSLTAGVRPGSDFLRHSFAIAMSAAKLAELHRKIKPETAFAAGLLHDIGAAALNRHAPNGDGELRSTELSAQITSLLGLPVKIVDALAAQRFAPNLEDASVLAQTIGIAKALAVVAGIGAAEEIANLADWQKTLNALLLTPADVLLLERDLADTVASEMETLGF